MQELYLARFLAIDNRPERYRWLSSNARYRAGGVLPSEGMLLFLCAAEAWSGEDAPRNNTKLSRARNDRRLLDQLDSNSLRTVSRFHGLIRRIDAVQARIILYFLHSARRDSLRRTIGRPTAAGTNSPGNAVPELHLTRRLPYHHLFPSSLPSFPSLLSTLLSPEGSRPPARVVDCACWMLH